jgi:hypothetical protein
MLIPLKYNSLLLFGNNDGLIAAKKSVCSLFLRLRYHYFVKKDNPAIIQGYFA